MLTIKSRPRVCHVTDSPTRQNFEKSFETNSLLLQLLPLPSPHHCDEPSNLVESQSRTYHIENSRNSEVTNSTLAMSSDEIVWQVINQQFCSFKLKYVDLDCSDSAKQS